MGNNTNIHIGPLAVLAAVVSVFVLAMCQALGACRPPARASAGPQDLIIRAGDGRELPARYYPAAAEPAPVIVIAADGTSGSAWEETGLVRWLQNRRADAYAAPDGFEPLPDTVSYGVLVYAQYSGWEEAGRAAITAARELPGADPDRIITFGASAGAVAAAAVCAEPGCAGALLFSPTASYDGIRFDALAEQLQANGRTVWCISTTGDSGCPAPEGSRHREIVYAGTGHGVETFSTGYAPQVGRDILSFLNCALDQDCE